jgi:LPPG:FO 2-phospho-L-lactate transferase
VLIGPVTHHKHRTYTCLERNERTAEKETVIAVSPIIGKEPVSGPAGKLMTARGLDFSSAGVVDCYGDILDIMILDERDTYGISALKDAACKILIADTLMKNVEKSTDLARFVVDALDF